MTEYFVLQILLEDTCMYASVGFRAQPGEIPTPRLTYDGVATEEKYQANGAYGLVTGATDGMGKALAEELARRGVCSASGFV